MFFPELQKRSSSNCGKLARPVFQNSARTAEILEIPEALVISLHKLLQVEARRSFDLWTSVFTNCMTANIHLLIAHGHLYLEWAQQDVGVPLGIEKCNQEVWRKDKYGEYSQEHTNSALLGDWSSSSL